jgi:peptidyl-prolyl cis-trans isomerase SurA
VALLAGISGVGNAWAQQEEAVLIDGIAAIVGNEIILQSEVQIQITILMAQEGMDPRTTPADVIEALHDQALNSLIDDKVLVARARRDTIEVERSEVDNAVDQRIEQFRQNAGGEAGFQQALLAEEMTEQELRRRLRDQLRNELLGQRVLQAQNLSRPTPVSRRQAAEFMGERGDELLIVLRHILLKPPEDSDPVEMAQRRILALRERIVSGLEDFESVARRESEDPGSGQAGGDLGEFERGMMVPEFDEVVWVLPIGEVSEPVRTQFGWHLIEVTARTDDKAQARHILIRPDTGGAAVSALSDTIGAIESALASGTPFLELVARYSEAEDAVTRGGHFLTIARTDPNAVANIPQDWIPAIQALEPGDWSTPVEDEDGVHILQRMLIGDEAIDLVLQLDFPVIEQTVQQVRRAEAIQAWIAELRRETYIEIKKD